MLTPKVTEIKRASAHARGPVRSSPDHVDFVRTRTVELRHLRYFVAVAEELHFRRAAERLHVAQPAVSEQIRKLEQELGVTLFNRSQRRVALTPAGTAFLAEARHVLRHADVAQQAARNARDRATTRLRIGYLPDSLPARVPRALRHLAVSAPSVEVELTTGPALRLIEAVRARRLDAVVTSLPAPTQGLRVTALGEQGAVVVLPATHPRAVDSAIDLRQLAPERLVALPRDADPAFHNAVVAMCHAAGLSPTFVELPEPRVEHVLLAVAAGAGPALLPEAATERFAAPGIRFVALETDEPVLRSAVLTHPDTDSLATLAFLRAIAQTAGRSAAQTPPAAIELVA
jgi:DNA-binding transcriptional LysR family regulator